MESIAGYVVQSFSKREGNQRAVNYKTGDYSELLLANRRSSKVKGFVQVAVTEKCTSSK